MGSRSAGARSRAGATPTEATLRECHCARILELAKNAENLCETQVPAEQRRLLETVLSNCTFDRGTLCPTYSKPFDLLVRGNETGEWLGGRDSNPDTVVQSHVSYRWTTSHLGRVRRGSKNFRL